MKNLVNFDPQQHGGQCAVKRVKFELLQKLGKNLYIAPNISECTYRRQFFTDSTHIDGNAKADIRLRSP